LSLVRQAEQGASVAGGRGINKENKMKLEKQVCSLELAKKLKELGVKQESLWFYNSKTMKLQRGFSAHTSNKGRRIK